MTTDGSLYLAMYQGTMSTTQQQLTLSNQIYQTDFVIASIVGHTGLTKIELTNVDIGSQGCDCLRLILKNPTSKLTVLHLNNIKIDDEGASIFATGLANNHTLKDLKLKLVHSTSDFSWQAIFTALHSTLFRSEKLDMTGNGIIKQEQGGFSIGS